jgi:hypothetical protein
MEAEPSSRMTALPLTMQITAQPLPGGIGLPIPHQLLPQHRAANQHLPPPQPQHIKQNDRNGKKTKQKKERR